MARKQERDPKQLAGLQDVKSLWRKLRLHDWLNLFQEIDPNGKWTQVSATTFKGICPYHDDHNPSLQVALHKGLAKCFPCGKVVVDPINLVAKLKGCSYTEALLFLHQRFDLTQILGANAEGLSKYNRVQETKKMAAIAMNQVMLEVLRDNPAHLSYCRPAVEYLRKVRAIPMETLHMLPVGVFAKPEHVKKYIDNKELHAIYDEYFAAYQSLNYWGALCFHYNDSPGTISRFRLRVMDRGTVPDVKDMAACAEFDDVRMRAMFQKAYVAVNDPYTQEVGIFGLHFYRCLIGNDDTSAYITEGEFDVLSTMAAQAKAGPPDFMIFGTGGNGSTNLNALRDYGIMTAWLVPDHPAKNGDPWVMNILGNKANFATNVHDRFRMKIFQWPIGLEGMDLDEAVRFNGYRTVCDHLYSKRNANFLNSVPWISAKCDSELAQHKRMFDERLQELDLSSETAELERTNLSDERRQVVKTIIMKWFRFISDPTDRCAFTNRYSVNEGIDISQISEVSTAMYSLNTMEGVCARVADALEEHFALAYYVPKSTDLSLYVWSKLREELTEFHTAERTLFKMLAVYVCSEVTDWFDRLLGDNEVYLSGTGKNPLNDNRVKRKNARDILMKALEGLMGKTYNLNELNRLSQGIHYIDLPAAARLKHFIYFVNGKRIFRGQFTPEDQLKWTRVNNAVDEGTLYEGLCKSGQWSFVEETSDLYAANQVDLLKTYNDIRTIIDGWHFEHHDTMAAYLAAYIMSLPIMRAVGNVNITFVTGEAESGKTSFAYGLLGGTRGNHHGITPILESSTFSSDASVASMYQGMEGSSLLYVLDEAERQSQNASSHEDRNQDIFNLLNGLPMGGVTVKRGGITKDQATTYLLRMPVLMAAINIPTDPTFLSRVLILYTVKEPGRRDLDLYMQDHFTDDQLEQLRRNITIGLLPHIPDIIARRNRLREELPSTSGGVVHVSNRFLDSVLTPLAVYDLIGRDAGALYRDILSKYKDRLEAIHGQDKQSPLLNACLYTAGIKRISEDHLVEEVSAKNLILKGDFSVLNSSESGVYYLADKDWIIIVWRQVKYAVLQRSPYIRIKESALREQASKNPHVVPEISAKEHQEVKFLLNLQDVKSAAEYTVLDANYILQVSNPRPVDPEAATSAEEGATSEPGESALTPETITESYEEEMGFTM